ncbi:uncharacterized protein F5147DRAFT_776832 [Suillus discolor]|uniref:DUF6532 domain-containing protein n=1 Tax=Suillus discolor TaxID=1912936 RepID=A0A9P7JR60_9AGAM|nr:uncharacterized protein F5147DRAFT_776832 [Suillus discolor]KAG2101104.1 hypothetical protein F5147DRAFT_776832 [Suillus discolor]
MPPRKKARHTSPTWSLSPSNSRTRKVTNKAPEDTDASRQRSEWSTRGVGGHVAQLKKAGEILMAPARQQEGRGTVKASDSEVNSMAPSQQLKKGKKKSSSADKQDPWEATQPIGRSSKKAIGESLECEARKDRMRDLDERDESENGANEQDHNDQPGKDEDSLLRDTQEAPVDRMALYGDEDSDTYMDLDQGDFDSQVSDDDTHHEATDTFNALEHHQMKNGQCKAPSPTHLARAHVSFCLSCTIIDMCPSLLANTGPPIHVKLARSLISIHPVMDLVAPPSNEHALLPLLGTWPLDARLTEHHLKKSHRPMCGQSVHLHTSLLLVQSPLNTYLILPPSANCLLVSTLQLSLWFLPVTNCPPLMDGLCHSLCPGILLSQIGHLLPLLVQADLTLVVPHLFNAANLEMVRGAPTNKAAKLEMWLQAVLLHPLPVHQDVVVLAQEVLSAVLWTYHMKKVKLDNGYFPEYKMPMSQLLCDDLFTFRMELKKIVISIVKQLYGIFSKGNSMHKERISAAAAKLLKTGEYLRLPDSSEGEYTNFVSQVLKEACLSFYYGNSKKALKLTDKFQHQIPVNGLILVAAVAKGVLSGFHDSGTDKVPDLTADTCRADFNILRKSVDKSMDVPERHVELEEMLKEWAEEGMIGELRNELDSAAGSEDINIII